MEGCCTCRPGILSKLACPKRCPALTNAIKINQFALCACFLSNARRACELLAASSQPQQPGRTEIYIIQLEQGVGACEEGGAHPAAGGEDGDLEERADRLQEVLQEGPPLERRARPVCRHENLLVALQKHRTNVKSASFCAEQQ